MRSDLIDGLLLMRGSRDMTTRLRCDVMKMRVGVDLDERQPYGSGGRPEV